MPEVLQYPLTDVSNGIAQVYKARYGNGPRRITTHQQDDAIVCLLRGVNTPAQAALVEYGKTDLAQELHEELQRGMAPEMSAVIERLTGRKVVGYIPGFDAAIDATTDVFLLEPAGGGDGISDRRPRRA